MQPIATPLCEVSEQRIAQNGSERKKEEEINKKCLRKTNQNQPFPFTVENYHRNHIPFDMNFWETGTCQVERTHSAVVRCQYIRRMTHRVANGARA